MNTTFTLSDIIFIVLEASILLAVLWEGIIALKDYNLNKKHFAVTQRLSDHQIGKYQRYKAKRLIKKAFNAKDDKDE